MDSVIPSLYKLNKIVLLCVGLWPCDVTIIQKVQRIGLVVTMVVIGLLQIPRIIQFRRDMQRLAFAFAPVSLMALILLRYTSIWYYQAEAKQLLDKIDADWRSIVQEEERQIMQKHTKFARNQTLAFFIMICPPVLAVVSVSWVPPILGMLGFNYTQPATLPIDVYLYVDQKEYFYYLLVLQSGVVIMATLIMVGTESFSVICLQHYCAALNLTGIRIKKAFAENSIFKATRKGGEFAFQKALMDIVTLHSRAINLASWWMSTLSIAYICVLPVGVMTISVYLYCFCQLEISLEHLPKILVTLSIVICNAGYPFFINFIGQKSIDQGNQLFYDTCNAEWYNTPKSSQKTLLILMIKTSNVFTCEICYLFSPSMEGFAVIFKTAVSYFTVMRSIQ